MPNKDKQNWLQRMIMTGAMAENPAVMTASGYRPDKEKGIIQDKVNDEYVKRLRQNLVGIGAAGAGAMAGAGTLWKVANNPVVSAGFDVATGNYGDAAVGLAADLMPFNKIMDFTKGIREINKINGNFITIDRPLPFTSRSKIRGYIAGYNEADPQIQELYNRIPYNTELVRKWSDLADDKNLSGLDRRKFIIDNVVSAVNRTSRTVDNNTNKKLLDDYLFKIRSNSAYGDRNLGMASDGREILHFGDDLTSTRTHFEGPQGVLINSPKLNGDISSVDFDDNNPFSKFDNSWKITNKSISGKVYIDNNSRNHVIESIRRILPENSDIKIDGFIHSDIGLYKPDRRINMFENKFNTSITGFNKDVIFNKVPQNSKWWEIPGFYDLKHKK